MQFPRARPGHISPFALVRAPAEHAFDFDTIADVAFLRALFAEPRRPHLLVQGSGVDVAGLATRIASYCPASSTCHLPGR
jgi:hypothetical protein